MKNLKKDKKGLEISTLGKWIIAIVILAIMVAGYIILRNKDIGIIKYIENLFRFKS